MKLFFILLFFPIISLANFSHESEWSSVMLKGNNDIETYNAKTSNRFDQERYNITFGGYYTLVKPFQKESARNWNVFTKYGQVIDRKLSAFIQELVEGNKFIGFDQRNNTDIGLSYDLINTDKKKSRVELGYRYTHEELVADVPDNMDQKGRLYIEQSQEINQLVWYKIWIEYLPNFTTHEDYMINFEPSLLVTLSKNLSLKTSYFGRYDNQPANDFLQYMDTTYMTSLLARF
jgi:putative salt-induced outer membrane protein